MFLYIFKFIIIYNKSNLKSAINYPCTAVVNIVNCRLIFLLFFFTLYLLIAYSVKAIAEHISIFLIGFYVWNIILSCIIILYYNLWGYDNYFVILFYTIYIFFCFIRLSFVYSISILSTVYMIFYTYIIDDRWWKKLLIIYFRYIDEWIKCQNEEYIPTVLYL